MNQTEFNRAELRAMYLKAAGIVTELGGLATSGVSTVLALVTGNASFAIAAGVGVAAVGLMFIKTADAMLDSLNRHGPPKQDSEHQVIVFRPATPIRTPWKAARAQVFALGLSVAAATTGILGVGYARHETNALLANTEMLVGLSNDLRSNGLNIQSMPSFGKSANQILTKASTTKDVNHGSLALSLVSLGGVAWSLGSLRHRLGSPQAS